MATYGYARVSTTDQDLSVQEDALRKAGCSVVRAEKISGTVAAKDRQELRTVLEFLREGDELVVFKLDRLARSAEELLRIVRELTERGVALRTVDGEIDTRTAAGCAFLGMLAVFAEFETNLRRERQAEGIAAAKAKGVYKGRKPSIDRDEVGRLRSEGLGASEIARQLGIGRASVYRVLEEV